MFCIHVWASSHCWTTFGLYWPDCMWKLGFAVPLIWDNKPCICFFFFLIKKETLWQRGRTGCIVLSSCVSFGLVWVLTEILILIHSGCTHLCLSWSLCKVCVAKPAMYVCLCQTAVLFSMWTGLTFGSNVKSAHFFHILLLYLQKMMNGCVCVKLLCYLVCELVWHLAVMLKFQQQQKIHILLLDLHLLKWWMAVFVWNCCAI